MEDKYNIVKQHSEIWRSLRDGEFEEEEVWSIIKDNIPNYKSNDKDYSPLSVPRTLPSAATMIPRTSTNNNSACSSHEIKVLQQSVPLNIPERAMIYRNNKQNKDVSRFGHDYDLYHCFDGGEDSDDEEEELHNDNDDEYGPKVPPHEFIARRLAMSQISSFSVFEGVGRTLKGRDLSKMRNDVLLRTGFLESL
ncbi:hypothetical protein TanjilG_08744 [Lupinus angustifolius]|uniref:Senescence regulator S40 n=1 Tax=Lupinus angustifolius TaxID=3871 RepID=A0A4P1QQ53_LUPAN|nr:PREDICTED: uncharacterized protein LOC109334053 [Lupinus angustifolius]XP_019425174.1 PREDICTED: uncharacterized protein LOC109334053 [Lupinus angustifolius]OIV92071.1 hypothetical protein TanjilG_08744 [Lupinus angustifolius]